MHLGFYRFRPIWFNRRRDCVETHYDDVLRCRLRLREMKLHVGSYFVGLYFALSFGTCGTDHLVWNRTIVANLLSFFVYCNSNKKEKINLVFHASLFALEVVSCRTSPCISIKTIVPVQSIPNERTHYQASSPERSMTGRAITLRACHQSSPACPCPSFRRPRQ